MDTTSLFIGMTAALTILCCSVLFQYARLIQRYKALTEQHRKEREVLKKEATNSQELTDFLADFKSHGYSFVRVDPGAVFMRSPREL